MKKRLIPIAIDAAQREALLLRIHILNSWLRMLRAITQERGNPSRTSM